MDTVNLEFLSEDGTPLRGALVLQQLDWTLLLMQLLSAESMIAGARVRANTEEAIDISYPGVLDAYSEVKKDRNSTSRRFIDSGEGATCIYRLTPRQGEGFEQARWLVGLRTQSVPQLQA